MSADMKLPCVGMVMVGLVVQFKRLFTYRFSEFSTLGETHITKPPILPQGSPRPASSERSHPSVEIQFSHHEKNRFDIDTKQLRVCSKELFFQISILGVSNLCFCMG